jgi:ribosomal protein S1
VTAIYRVGDLVTGVVTEHRNFGVFIDIGDEEPAVAVITMLDDEPKTPATWPDIGTTVEGVFLGYSGPGHQPRISLRPGDIRDAQSQR